MIASVLARVAEGSNKPLFHPHAPLPSSPCIIGEEKPHNGALHKETAVIEAL